MVHLDHMLVKFEYQGQGHFGAFLLSPYFFSKTCHFCKLQIAILTWKINLQSFFPSFLSLFGGDGAKAEDHNFNGFAVNVFLLTYSSIGYNFYLLH